MRLGNLLSPMKIRAVKPKDIAQIELIEKASFIDPYPKNLLFSLAVLSPEAFLVAEYRCKIIGYVSAVIECSRTTHIASLAVHPQYRRRRIAYLLMSRLITVLREMDLTSIRLEVRHSNKAAQKLYRSMGFRHLRKIRQYYEDGEDATVMGLNLKAI